MLGSHQNIAQNDIAFLITSNERTSLWEADFGTLMRAANHLEYPMFCR